MPVASGALAAWATSGMLENLWVAGGLKTRVITGLAIATIGLSALFLLAPGLFALLAIVVLAGLGGWEGARLAGIGSLWGRVVFAITMLAAAGLLFAFAAALPMAGLLGVACGLWLAGFLWLGAPDLGRAATLATTTVKLGMLALVLQAAWMAIAWLQAASPWYVVMLMILIASADTFAYFTGKTFGGPKLAPRISPGKTRSGAAGGLIGAVALTALAALLLPESPFTPVEGAILALVLAPVSIGGDLFFSLLKRQAGLKDTSALLPGHGGILDRFDSLSAALPFFALAVMLWGH